MTEAVYKIMSASAFQAAQHDGRFAGSPDDVRDGFIHLSAADQVAGTLATHFAGQEGLVLLAVDALRLGDGLKWETSRSGMTFPHLYAPLDLKAVLWSETLPLDTDGRHVLPEAVETPA
jgi:uncharacterized protein (DUF952 family)